MGLWEQALERGSVVRLRHPKESTDLSPGLQNGARSCYPCKAQPNKLPIMQDLSASRSRAGNNIGTSSRKALDRNRNRSSLQLKQSLDSHWKLILFCCPPSRMTGFWKTSLPLLASTMADAAGNNMAQGITELQALAWSESSTLFPRPILDTFFFVAFSVIKTYQRHRQTLLARSQVDYGARLFAKS